jgi:hypothetical protein
MRLTQYKELAIALLVVGEALMIGAEMYAARTNTVMSRPYLQVFLLAFVFIIVGGGFLVAGYMLGFRSFKNIWIVSAASITTILIIEPILAYAFFHQLPTKVVSTNSV